MKDWRFIAAAYTLGLIIPIWLGVAAIARARRAKKRLEALEAARQA